VKNQHNFHLTGISLNTEEAEGKEWNEKAAIMQIRNWILNELYLVILSFIFRGFEQLIQNSDLFICDVCTVRLH